jgi:hypothetical protein
MATQTDGVVEWPGSPMSPMSPMAVESSPESSSEILPPPIVRSVRI